MTPPAADPSAFGSGASSSKQILFVSADAGETSAVRAGLEDMRPKWELECTNSAARGAARVRATEFAAAVVDLLLPERAGVKLLKEIMEISPTTLRIGLTTGSERQSVLQVGAPAHQLLSKPCDPTVLKAVLARAFAARDFVSHDEFRRLIAGIHVLPVLPEIYVELMQELKSEDPSLERAGQLVAKDMGLSAKILQLVNSAFFALGRTIAHPAEAAIFLGSEALRSLVLSLQVFAQFQHLRSTELSVDSLWKHSWATGVLAKRLCELEDVDRATVDEAFVSGLLHDLGKLILAVNFPDKLDDNFRQARRHHRTLWEQENLTWGASHAELGGYLLGLWGLPESVVEAVAFHHRPAQARRQAFCALTAVHVANTMGRPPGDVGTLAHDAVDLDYLRSLGLADRVEEWKQFFRETSERRS